MSVSKNATHSKASIVTLIKDSQFLALPIWLQEYIHLVLCLRECGRPTAIFSRQDYLEGFVYAMGIAGAIKPHQAFYLTQLATNAAEHALADFKNKQLQAA